MECAATTPLCEPWRQTLDENRCTGDFGASAKTRDHRMSANASLQRTIAQRRDEMRNVVRIILMGLVLSVLFGGAAPVLALHRIPNFPNRVLMQAVVQPRSPLTPQQTESIDAFISEELARQHIPGLAVGVFSRGRILLSKGYGLANVELSVPVHAVTLFQSGSDR